VNHHTSIIAALLDAHHGATTIETHISTIILTGHHVYKIKKPVNLAFLDFSTLDRRRHFCQEEITLNQPLAPGVYRRALPITRDAQGRIELNGHGQTIEWAIEMVRLPADRMLAHLLEEGHPPAVQPADIDALVDRIARFHEDAPTGEGIDEHGTPDEIRRRVLHNLDECEPFRGPLPRQPRPGAPTLEPAIDRRLRDWSDAFIQSRADLLRARIREHRIRDGHADLHAGNICLTTAPDAHTYPVIYDRLEFSPPLRRQDVAADVAFLAMDLDDRGHPELTEQLVERYADTTSDPHLATLQPLYRARLAAVRGKVRSISATEQGDPAWSEAVRYFALAAGYTLPPSLVLTCGLPATGKSTLAKSLAVPLRAVVLRSDLVRKELAGLAPRERAPQEIYSDEWTTRTYDTLRARAADALTRSRHVIVDANFPTRAFRNPFAALAREHGAPFAILHATADDDTVRARMHERSRDTNEPSDADFDVYLRLKARFQPPAASEHALIADPHLHHATAAARVVLHLLDSID